MDHKLWAVEWQTMISGKELSYTKDPMSFMASYTGPLSALSYSTIGWSNMITVTYMYIYITPELSTTA